MFKGFTSVRIIRATDTPASLGYQLIDTLFGRVVLVGCERGICYLGFTVEESPEEVFSCVGKIWPEVPLVPDPELIKQTVPSDGIIRLYLKGTPFQMRVWEGLLQIKAGETCTYSGLAGRIGLPSATRAVASAVAANPVSMYVPCHRIIRKGGDTGNYHWGRERKKVILRAEQDAAADRVIRYF